MHIETIPAKKYYGPHAVGSVALVDGQPHHASKQEIKIFVRLLGGTLIPSGNCVCGICSCKATCVEKKPFLLGTMESAAVLVATDKELNTRVAAGEIPAFRMFSAERSENSGASRTANDWFYEQAAKLPKDHNRMMHWLCQVPIMELVEKENRWQRKSAKRA
jgi:hypothetical protein